MTNPTQEEVDAIVQQMEISLEIAPRDLITLCEEAGLDPTFGEHGEFDRALLARQERITITEAPPQAQISARCIVFGIGLGLFLWGAVMGVVELALWLGGKL